MSINRHNYEAFFLLYVDNELTASQQAELEYFLLQNPDLKDELQMFKRAVLEVEPKIIFDDKTLLLKSSPGISLDNYETYFLLYVDEELSSNERIEVERFVLQHPSLQEGFTLLRQTRLVPELVVYGDKGKLLHYSKPARKLYPVRWQRLASAAAIAGLVLLVWFIPKSNTSTRIPADKIVQHSPAPNNPDAKTPVATVKKEELAQTAMQPFAGNTKETFIRGKRNILTEAKHNEKRSEKIMQNSVDPSVNKNGIPIAVNDKRNEENLIIKNGITGLEAHILPVEQPAATSYISNTSENSNVQHALYRETDADDEEDRTLLIGGAEINKNKLRGLLKKAVNIFDRRLKKDDKEFTVQLANFEIKTK